MSWYMPTCKEASQLALQKELRSLSRMGHVRLRIHMAICEVCKAFDHQMMVISTSAKRCECGAEMSPECQARLNERLRQEMNGE